jgi:hypothetical protein
MRLLRIQLKSGAPREVSHHTPGHCGTAIPRGGQAAEVMLRIVRTVTSSTTLRLDKQHRRLQPFRDLSDAPREPTCRFGEKGFDALSGL